MSSHRLGRANPRCMFHGACTGRTDGGDHLPRAAGGESTGDGSSQAAAARKKGRGVEPSLILVLIRPCRPGMLQCWELRPEKEELEELTAGRMDGEPMDDCRVAGGCKRNKLVFERRRRGASSASSDWSVARPPALLLVATGDPDRQPRGSTGAAGRQACLSSSLVEPQGPRSSRQSVRPWLTPSPPSPPPKVGAKKNHWQTD